ncbi:hypothetical protein Turpa_2983 [Turneriella parva DSM 21527]|uniref:GerMN domain-containing protein n=1 Tax=Turneriella parva (strain ATCC BAA-1111 / DSM 21527 / NCTC 11395 / H) TaxID=869212 RepID=I4B8L5_TURPD|nr:hypothetical protein Turpa_2983 [Turneriella parva DSM 21527]
MSRGGRKPAGGDGQNLVTILFVLGVIGWGFFAIDRLTEPATPQKVSKVQGRATGQESGWRKTAREWLTQKIGTSAPQPKTSEKARVSRNVAADEVPMVAEPGNLKAELAEEAGDTLIESRADPERLEAMGKFYFYKLNSKGQPVLAMLERPTAAAGNLKGRLNELIRGPSGAEQDKDFIDSFIRKPRVLGASVKGRCTAVDFDTNFGSGVSYQTLRLQIQQLYKNTSAWQGTECLEITLRGKYSPHLGTDGLFFPRRIDAAWLKQNL